MLTPLWPAAGPARDAKACSKAKSAPLDSPPILPLRVAAFAEGAPELRAYIPNAALQDSAAQGGGAQGGGAVSPHETVTGLALVALR